MSAPAAIHDQDVAFLAELEAIATRTPRGEIRSAAAPGLIGRLFGKAPAFGDAQRLQLEASPEVDACAAVIVAYTLVDALPRDVARLLPEALVNAALPDDGEERFMSLAQAARGVVRRHLDRSLLGATGDELRPIKLRALALALQDASLKTLAERLDGHFNAGWTQRARDRRNDIDMANEDPLLVEIDNVVLGDVAEDGTMPYSMDIVVDGVPLATVASPGDGSIEARAWLGQHGPEDLDAFRHHVARYGRPRSDEHGDRPDSLEEMLVDRVVSLFTRFTFQQDLSDAVLFCDRDGDAPGGHVIRVAPIGPCEEREDVWAAVGTEYPDAVLLDLLDPDEAFTLWLAYSNA